MQRKATHFTSMPTEQGQSSISRQVMGVAATTTHLPSQIPAGPGRKALSRTASTTLRLLGMPPADQTAPGRRLSPWRGVVLVRGKEHLQRELQMLMPPVLPKPALTTSRRTRHVDHSRPQMGYTKKKATPDWALLLLNGFFFNKNN